MSAEHAPQQRRPAARAASNEDRDHSTGSNPVMGVHGKQAVRDLDDHSSPKTLGDAQSADPIIIASPATTQSVDSLRPAAPMRETGTHD